MSTNQEPPKTARGALIVVEGLDRAGKSTQVARLAARWSKETGLPAEAIRFPDRSTAIGQNLNTYLTQTSSDKPLPLAAAHLLFSANRWEASHALESKLSAGISLIVDRYAYSGAVYTAAKGTISADAVDQAMTLDWTWAPEMGLPAPDMLLFLDIDEEEAQRRGGFGSERYETLVMQRAVRQMFYELLRRLKSRAVSGGNVVRVNANREIDPVFEEMWAAVGGLHLLVKNGQLPELRRLEALPDVAALASD